LLDFVEYNYRLYPSHIAPEHAELPHILTGNVNVTAYVGETTTLPCEVANLGGNHVNWLKFDENNTPITLTVGYHQFSRNMRFRVARIHDQKKVESWNFEIRKVSPEDQGMYECYIKLNSRHKTKANVYLTVKSEKGNGLPAGPSLLP
jgi:hypothetical protein